MRIALCQTWTETERGWGQRPDGYSLHLNEEALEEYLAKDSKQKRRTGVAPDEYSFPDISGEYWCEIDEETHNLLLDKKSIRRYDKVCPEGVSMNKIAEMLPELD